MNVSLPGELIEVGDTRLHVLDEGTGKPPLLLTSGLGDAWFNWEPTAAALRTEHRVIRMDRSGLGGSPPAHGTPTLHVETDRLAAVAEWAGAPVIVVAHSYAAFHAEALARLRPELVSGLVLVDPSCEPGARVRVRTSKVRIPIARAVGALGSVTRTAPIIGPLGFRLVMRWYSRRGHKVPAEFVRAVYGRGDVLAQVLVELAVYNEMATDLLALRRERPLPETPFVVLTALGDYDNQRQGEAWRSCHAKLAALSPVGKQVVLPDSKHLVAVDRPDAIVAAIAEMKARR